MIGHTPRYMNTQWQMYRNEPVLGLGEVTGIRFGYFKAQGTIINLWKQLYPNLILITLSLFLSSCNYVFPNNPTGHFSELQRVLPYQGWWEIVGRVGRQRSLYKQTLYKVLHERKALIMQWCVVYNIIIVITWVFSLRLNCLWSWNTSNGTCLSEMNPWDFFLK